MKNNDLDLPGFVITLRSVAGKTVGHDCESVLAEQIEFKESVYNIPKTEPFNKTSDYTRNYWVEIEKSK